MKENKYIHYELVEAIQEIKDRGNFNHEVDASKRAGQILKKGLSQMDITITEEEQKLEDQEAGYKAEDTFSNDLGL